MIVLLALIAGVAVSASQGWILTTVVFAALVVVQVILLVAMAQGRGREW